MGLNEKGNGQTDNEATIRLEARHQAGSWRVAWPSVILNFFFQNVRPQDNQRNFLSSLDQTVQSAIVSALIGKPKAWLVRENFLFSFLSQPEMSIDFGKVSLRRLGRLRVDDVRG